MKQTNLEVRIHLPHGHWWWPVTALSPSLLLQLLRTNEFCLDQFLNFCYDPHIPSHQFSCSPLNWQLLSSFRGKKRQPIIIIGCNYSCVAGTELLLLTAVILSAFELLYDPMARNNSPWLEKHHTYNILQSLSSKCQTGWLWTRKQDTKPYLLYQCSHSASNPF